MGLKARLGPSARAHDLADCVHHMDGDADGRAWSGGRAADCLPDLPRGVGCERVAAPDARGWRAAWSDFASPPFLTFPEGEPNKHQRGDQ